MTKPGIRPSAPDTVPMSTIIEPVRDGEVVGTATIAVRPGEPTFVYVRLARFVDGAQAGFHDLYFERYGPGVVVLVVPLRP